MDSDATSVDYYVEVVSERMAMCVAIADAARRKRVNVTAVQVNKHYSTWLKWYTGRWALGRVLGQTGLRKGE